LYLTGYPQIGRGQLHIAHVLWGGLLLFTACLVMLIYSNHWALSLGAFLAGVGVGLFIDEVGKFITRSNDYFYPTAAPLIYALFLITVLLYIILSKPGKDDARTTLYYTMDDLQEVLDQDLSDDEKARIQAELHDVLKRNERPDLSLLAKYLDEFIDNKKLYTVPQKPKFWDPWINRFKTFEEKWFTHQKFRFALAGATLALSAWSLSFAVQIYLSMRNPAEYKRLMGNLLANRLIQSGSGLTWFEARIGLEGAIGLMLLLTAVLLLVGKERSGILLGYTTLVFTITIVNLVVFYFDQFSNTFDAIIQFMILFGFLRYRRRFLKNV
jgi:hypothetical protein